MLPQADIGDAAAAALAHVEDPHLVDYVRIVYKKRWLVAITFLLVLAGAAAYLHRATPQYEATVELFIGPDGGNAVHFSENEPPEQGKVDYYQTQYKLLQSRELAKQTIDALKLWDGAEVTQPANAGPQWLSDLKARLIDLEARVTGSEPRVHDSEESSGADKAAGTDGSVETRKVQTFLSHLRVEPVRNSRLVDVSFRSPDPTTAATVANALADAYIQRNLQFRTATSKEASGWLQGQLEEQKQKVEQSEAAVQRYLEQNDGVTLDQRQDIVLQKLVDVNSAVTKAKTERIEKESMFRQIESAKENPEALNTFPSILANTVIQEERGEIAKLQSQLRLLSEKLGDRHPDIIKTKAALQMAEDRERGEIEKVVQSVRADYENAAAHERSLLDALGQQKSESLRQSRKGIEFSVLQREAEGNRQLYNNLLQRTKEAGVSADVSTSSIRVVDRADVPLHPVSPKRTMTLLLALFGGAFCSLGLAFFIEYFDPRLKTPDDVRGHLRLTSLGLVPRARGWRLPKHLLINGRVPPEFAEAFKTIRTNLLFGSSVQGGRSLLITRYSPRRRQVAGDGESGHRHGGGGVPGRGDRCRLAPAESARTARHQPGARLHRRHCPQAETRDLPEDDIDPAPVSAARRTHGGAAVGVARDDPMHPGAGRAESALRLDSDRHAADDCRRRRAHAGPRRDRRRVCGGRRHDQPSPRARSPRSVGARARALCRRRAQPHQARRASVLLRPLLPQEIQPLLRPRLLIALCSRPFIARTGGSCPWLMFQRLPQS